MPGYKGHLIGSTTLGAVYTCAVDYFSTNTISDKPHFLAEPQMLAGLMVISILFGLWPDVDTNSKGQDIFYGIAILVDIGLILTHRMEAAAILGLVSMTPTIGKHRGWTHSKLAMLVVPAAIFALPLLYRPDLMHLSWLIYGAAVTGYFSHLLLDGKIVPWIRFECGSPEHWRSHSRRAAAGW
jgi:membrane-bound metal-dependent hydrolase YbcI (DUF457 family)